MGIIRKVRTIGQKAAEFHLLFERAHRGNCAPHRKFCDASFRRTRQEWIGNYDDGPGFRPDHRAEGFIEVVGASNLHVLKFQAQLRSSALRFLPEQRMRWIFSIP